MLVRMDAATIRLALLEGRALFRQSLSRFLSSQQGFAVVAECGSSAELLEILANTAIDVVLADFDLASERGADFIATTRSAGFSGGILILTDIIDGRESAAVLKAGGSGIFLKSKPLERLIQAIKLLSEGEISVDETVIRLLAQNYPPKLSLGQPLTPPEQEVLDGLLEGLTSRRIGTRIGRSEASVKAILQQLFAKTGVRSRSQLIRVAIEGRQSYG